MTTKNRGLNVGNRPFDYLRVKGKWASRFLDTVGDGSGSIEADIDGETVPTVFKYSVPEGKILLVDRLVVWIRDFGAFDAEKYGNGLTLSAGIIGGSVDNKTNVFTPRTTQLPVKSNSDWPAYAFDFTYIPIGTGDNVAVAQYVYENDGAPLVFYGGTGYGIKIADNLSGLTGHRFRIGCVLCPDN